MSEPADTKPDPTGPQPGPEELERPYVQVTVMCDVPINLVINLGKNVRLAGAIPIPQLRSPT